MYINCMIHTFEFASAVLTEILIRYRELLFSKTDGSQVHKILFSAMSPVQDIVYP